MPPERSGWEIRRAACYEASRVPIVVNAGKSLKKTRPTADDHRFAAFSVARGQSSCAGNTGDVVSCL